MVKFNGCDIMKLKSKLKIPIENWVMLIIFALGVLLITCTIYLIIDPSGGDTIGEIIPVNVTLNPTDQQMEQIKQSHEGRAVKIQENGEYYLYIYGVNMNGEKIVGKYPLTKEQYDYIDTNGIYWFEIKYKKANDRSAGTIKRVYDQKPF